MQSESSLFESSLALADIARIFRLTLEGRGVQFGSIRDDDPFAALTRPPDFQAVASHAKNIGQLGCSTLYFRSGRCIAHLKNWKILATGYRRPLRKLAICLTAITALEFYRLNWNEF